MRLRLVLLHTRTLEGLIRFYDTEHCLGFVCIIAPQSRRGAGLTARVRVVNTCVAYFFLVVGTLLLSKVLVETAWYVLPTQHEARSEAQYTAFLVDRGHGDQVAGKWHYTCKDRETVRCVRVRATG